MKYTLLIIALFGVSSLLAAYISAEKGETLPISAKEIPCPENSNAMYAEEAVLTENATLRISALGQGVAPANTTSPAQAYALAKRAAIADAYRIIAEKVKGVRVDGHDLIKNMMVQRSTIRTSVQAMVRNANVIETHFKDGLCEVEMEMVLSYSQFAQ